MPREARDRKQMHATLEADHPERPTVTLDWSLEHPLVGIPNISVLLFELMVSRSGWHRNRGADICSQREPMAGDTATYRLLFGKTLVGDVRSSALAARRPEPSIIATRVMIFIVRCITWM